MSQELMVITQQEEFRGVSMDVIEHEGQPWFKAEDIGKALGFSAPRESVIKIFNRKRDEFATLSTEVTVTSVDGKQRLHRVFSIIGVFHLITIAKTEGAEGLRNWLVSFLLRSQEVQARRIKALEAEKLMLGHLSSLNDRLSSVERRLARRKYTARVPVARDSLPSEVVAEIQVAMDQLMAKWKCMSISVIKQGERIPEPWPFFILQRPYEKPHLYARLGKARHGLQAMGHRWSTKTIAMAFRELGHRPEQFKWSNQSIRGWVLEMAAIAEAVPDMISLSLN